jgi:hypothetical protein
MSDIQVTWRGLAIGGEPTPYHVDTVSGWDDSGADRDMSEGRVRGHGEHVGNLHSGSRVVTVEGTIAEPVDRNTHALALADVTGVSSAVETLTVTTFGRTLTSGARLIRRSLTIGSKRYGAGLVPFALQWRCPDPKRYGATVTTSTGLPTAGTGLAYPLTYPLTYGTLGNPGQLVLTNSGTADSPIRFDVTGPLPSGFELSAGGRRLLYPVAVPAGQVVTIDTAAGTVVVEGTANRRAELVVADWLTVPAGSALTVQFTSLGGTYDPAAVATATYASAWW